MLLAEVLSPAVHPGEVRFPARRIEVEDKQVTVEEIEEGKEIERDGSGKGLDSSFEEGEIQRNDAQMRIRYTERELEMVLKECEGMDSKYEKYKQCAIRMTAAYAEKGFVNTKAYALEDANGPYIIVVPGRIAEIKIISSKNSVEKIVRRFTKRLKGQVLNTQRLSKYLQLLKSRIAGVTKINAGLSRLGGDQSKSRLVLEVVSKEMPVRGEIELGNNGSLTGGEFDSQAVILKSNALKTGDSFLVYNEVYFEKDLEVPQWISSLSYRYPVTPWVNIATGVSITNQYEPNTQISWDDFSSRQFQYTSGIEVGLSDNLFHERSVGFSVVGQQSRLKYQGRSLPEVVPGIIRAPESGYMQLSMSQYSKLGFLDANIRAYAIKALPGITPVDQVRELGIVGVNLDEANAFGGSLQVVNRTNRRIVNKINLYGQYAIGTLMEPMKFSLGSNMGFKGLPDQIVNGDSGWAAIGESKIEIGGTERAAIFLQPYIGYGYVSSSFGALMDEDYIGAFGVFGSVETESGFGLELGYIKSILEEDSRVGWGKWVLSNGLYGRLKYRF